MSIAKRLALKKEYGRYITVGERLALETLGRTGLPKTVDESGARTLFVDGWTIKSNPSPFGGGFTVTDASGGLIHREEVRRRFTNNEGELLGINYAARLATERLHISTDSRIALGWVKKGNAGTRHDLDWIAKETQRLVQQKSLRVIWQPREENKAGQYNEHHTT